MAYIESVGRGNDTQLWRNDSSWSGERKHAGFTAERLYLFVANDPKMQVGVVISEERKLDRDTCILDFAPCIGLYPADEAWELFELHRRML